MKSIRKQPKAINTKAFGCIFRSRLEARYAVAFTEARIEWRYEPEGFDLGSGNFYLPDFWLPQVSMWAEIKPVTLTDDELRKCALLANQTGFPCLLLIDLPDAVAYWAIGPKDHEEIMHTVGGVMASVMDYELFTGYDYHLTQSRFFAYTDPDLAHFPMPHESSWGYVPPCVEAARSARFEHGEYSRPLPIWKVR